MYVCVVCVTKWNRFFPDIQRPSFSPHHRHEPISVWQRQVAVVNHTHADEHVRARTHTLRWYSGDILKSQGGSSVSSSAWCCLSPSLPVLGHVSREIIIQLLNEDRNTVPNVSLSSSLLTATSWNPSWICLSLRALLSSFSHPLRSVWHERRINCSTSSFALSSPPLLLWCISHYIIY